MSRNTTPIISFCAGALLFTAFHSEAAEHREVVQDILA